MSNKLIEGEDFYREGPFVVFTEKFLRERGYCCASGCRHCPYGFRPDQRSDVPPASDEEDEEDDHRRGTEDTE